MRKTTFSYREAKKRINPQLWEILKKHKSLMRFIQNARFHTEQFGRIDFKKEDHPIIQFGAAFTWNKSEEGYAYWFKINDEILTQLRFRGRVSTK